MISFGAIAGLIVSIFLITRIIAPAYSLILGAAMVNAGAALSDHLPHCPFFLTTAGTTSVQTKEQFKLNPYKSAIRFLSAFFPPVFYWLV